MIYVVAPTLQRFQDFCSERGVPTRTRTAKGAVWVGSQDGVRGLRGRRFEPGDRVVVLEGDWPGKDLCINELRMMEVVTSTPYPPPVWEWWGYFDTPPALDMASVERWLRA